MSSTHPRTLVFAGDGELAKSVRAEMLRLPIESDARLIGFQNQSQPALLCGACNALIMASNSEPCGLVVNEAVTAGMFGVGSDLVGEGPDHGPDPEFAFPAGHVERLARVQSTLCEQPDWMALQKRYAAA
jgi:hypothetical protein